MDALTKPDTADNEADAADASSRPRRRLERVVDAIASRLTLSEPVWVLILMVFAYTVVFGTLTLHQQHRYGTFGFDMGIFDQGIWLLSRFKNPFVTVRGLNYFGNHVNVSTALLVPFYWLGGGAGFLSVFQSAAVALGAVPIYLLGRDRFDNEWSPLGISLAYLLFPSLEWITWWHFHPDTMAIAPLLFAYWLATRKRWKPFAVAVALTLLAKEDAAMAVFVLGLLVAWKYSRRAGLITSGAAVAWFLFAVKLVIPWANHGMGPFYAELFPGFGNTPFLIAWNMVRHPSRVLSVAGERDRRTYYRQLLAPVGGVALFAPIVLLIAFPILLINITSVQHYTYEIKYQYSSLVAAAIFLATVESIARLGRGRPGLQRFLVGYVVACALATNVALSPSPLSVKYHTGIWAEPTVRGESIAAALKLVPKNAGVAATYYLVPQLTHRVNVYEFPNPFRQANWGIKGENPPDPRTAQYLVLDTSLNGESQPLYDKLTGPGGDYRIIYNNDAIVVAKRRG